MLCESPRWQNLRYEHEAFRSGKCIQLEPNQPRSAASLSVIRNEQSPLATTSMTLSAFGMDSVQMWVWVLQSFTRILVYLAVGTRLEVAAAMVTMIELNSETKRGVSLLSDALPQSCLHINHNTSGSTSSIVQI